MLTIEMENIVELCWSICLKCIYMYTVGVGDIEMPTIFGWGETFVDMVKQNFLVNIETGPDGNLIF